MFPNRGFETFICKYPTVYQWSEHFYTLNNNWKVLKQNKLLAVQICSLHEKKNSNSRKFCHCTLVETESFPANVTKDKRNWNKTLIRRKLKRRTSYKALFGVQSAATMFAVNIDFPQSIKLRIQANFPEPQRKCLAVSKLDFVGRVIDSTGQNAHVDFVNFNIRLSSKQIFISLNQLLLSILTK